MTSGKQGAVVLVSGGLDSSVLLHHVVKNLKRDPVHVISYHYAQRHLRELECATFQVAQAGAAVHRIIDISFLGELLSGGTALVTGGSEVPDLAELDEVARRQPPTYVPNRNMILLSLAVGYAEANGIHEVYYGAQAQDDYGYWDCTYAFIDRINDLLGLNRGKPVQVLAPLTSHSKADNVRLGDSLGVQFSQTWSCYRGGEVACGACPTCVERLKAFEIVGEVDPIPYVLRPR